MKILFGTMQYERAGGLGTERYLSILARELIERGHEVSILAGDPAGRHPPSNPGDSREPGPVPVYHHPTRGNLAVEGIAPGRLLPFLRRENPDWVHVANPAHTGTGLLAAARTLGASTAVTLMDYWWLCPKHVLLTDDKRPCPGDVPFRTCAACLMRTGGPEWLGQTRRWPGFAQSAFFSAAMAYAAVRQQGSIRELIRWFGRRRWLAAVLDRCDTVIAPSLAILESMQSRLEQPIHHIPYGLEPQWFNAPPRPPDTLPRDRARPVLGFAGGLAHHKGPHLLLEAARRLDWRLAKLVLAGPVPDAGYGKRLRELAEGLDVEFAGPLPPDRMGAFYRRLDLLVVPSLWPENLPFTMLEAVSQGIPVLGSSAAGVAEFIRDRRFVFERGSADSLADALRECLPNLSSFEFPRVNASGEMAEATLKRYRRHSGDR